MKVIRRKRGCGKTAALIQMSNETGCTIVCATATEALQVGNAAKRKGVEINTPISIKSLVEYKNCGTLNTDILIDNIEKVLTELLKCHVFAITVTSPGDSYLEQVVKHQRLINKKT